ncbi:MAG: hypothetical protein EOO71_09245 [Myxococcaceae bacterium]|nr:MAG: hypothetical protein EOO71_09245 [Myxococcaceae bacterium]
MAEGKPGRSAMSEFVDTVEKEARSRFVRWDRALWTGFVQGPVARMGQAMAASGQNLSENLESAPPWVQRLFCRVGANMPSLDDIEGHLHAIANAAMEPPADTLGDTSTALWVDLSQEDNRFMPGEVHFLAPTVVCVHDRHRATAAGGRDAATQGVWLSSKKPMLLGPMGCNERLEPTRTPVKALTSLSQRDPRAGDWYSTLRNEWRAVATMHTSQWLAVILPS